jgi:hypothetical protein
VPIKYLMVATTTSGVPTRSKQESLSAHEAQVLIQLREALGDRVAIAVHCVVLFATRQGAWSEPKSPRLHLESLNRIRRAARLWLTSLFTGNLDGDFQRSLREDWLPTMLAGGSRGAIQPGRVHAQLEHLRGVVAGLFLDEPRAERAKTLRLWQAWNRAIDLQLAISGA